MTANEIIGLLGNAATDVFEQMEMGNWVDEKGHPVRNNVAMIDLLNAVKEAIKFRDTFIKEKK